ncbi:hypothetical protein Val02_15230 [Virgisporangium aliadipatigenens]|uniref:Integrase n=1 Tax=Virgisporangium aliadipatigenens TaxID=741659 RepID=A0A8J4DPP1_9ACTN|nr:hypothetical protein Val02_15230 [Virgisporangium aliadipatigenens]
MSAPQVVEWAGHSVHVLMKVYAKCIDGQQEEAMKRIEAVLQPFSVTPIDHRNRPSRQPG